MRKENLKWTLAVMLDRLRDNCDGQQGPLSPQPELKDGSKLGGTAGFSYMLMLP